LRDLLAQNLDHIGREGNGRGADEADKADPTFVGRRIRKGDVFSRSINPFLLESIEHIALGFGISRTGEWDPEKLKTRTLPDSSHLHHAILNLNKVNWLDRLIHERTVVGTPAAEQAADDEQTYEDGQNDPPILHRCLLSIDRSGGRDGIEAAC